MIDHAKQYEPANYGSQADRLLLYESLTDDGKNMVNQIADALQAGQRKHVERRPAGRKSPQLLGEIGARELALALLSTRAVRTALERK